MHEASMAADILKLSAETAGSRAEKVRYVVVRVGELAGVMTDSLVFAFNALKGGFGLNNSEIRIEKQPVSARCAECDCEYTPEGFPFVCPSCGSKHFRIISGEEVFVKELELDK